MIGLRFTVNLSCNGLGMIAQEFQVSSTRLTCMDGVACLLMSKFLQGTLGKFRLAGGETFFEFLLLLPACGHIPHYRGTTLNPALFVTQQNHAELQG